MSAKSLSEEKVVQNEYWMEQVRKSLKYDNLDFIRRSTDAGRNRKEIPFDLDRTTRHRVTTLCDNDPYLIFTFYAAAINVLFYRYSSQEYIYTITDILSETSPDHSKKTRALLTSRISGDDSFKSIFNNLKREMNSQASSSFALSENGLSFYAGANLHAALLIHPDSGSPSSRAIYPFVIGFIGWPDIRDCNIVFDPLQFDESVILNFSGNFKTMLEEILKDPYLPVKKYDYLRSEELMLLTDVFNRTSAVYPAHELLTAGFSKQCSLDSDSIAVYDGQQEVSYRNLDLLSQGVSGYLRKQLSVKKGHRVGIYMDRGVDMIAAMLGILQAGAVLVPIDTAYPLQRIADILMDSGLQVLITDSFYMHNLPDAFSGALMAMDLQQADFLSLPDDDHEIHLEKDDPCYLLYTSGSTG
ncbi:AMP-binding protein, partial [Puia dinghuensis]|uniref:AMP-binding protein n=1 Tax=Puia dinghuensis TaxID=1792502 RepID=UPI001667EAA4